ncbi:hypothetical protein PTKIN_Ptkin10aG0010300 [Pterospermum kingtungense]
MVGPGHGSVGKRSGKLTSEGSSIVTLPNHVKYGIMHEPSNIRGHQYNYGVIGFINYGMEFSQTSSQLFAKQDDDVESVIFEDK